MTKYGVLGGNNDNRMNEKREKKRNERTSSFNHRYLKMGTYVGRIICHNNDIKFVFFCLLFLLQLCSHNLIKYPFVNFLTPLKN